MPRGLAKGPSGAAHMALPLASRTTTMAAPGSPLVVPPWTAGGPEAAFKFCFPGSWLLSAAVWLPHLLPLEEMKKKPWRPSGVFVKQALPLCRASLGVPWQPGHASPCRRTKASVDLLPALPQSSSQGSRWPAQLCCSTPWS